MCFTPYRLGGMVVGFAIEIATLFYIIDNRVATTNKLISAKLPLGGFGISRYQLDFILSEKAKKNNVLIIGGGSSVIKNLSYIKDYLSKNPKTFLIFSSSRNLSAFTKIKNKALVCITGNEARKIHKKSKRKSNDCCLFLSLLIWSIFNWNYKMHTIHICFLYDHSIDI